MQAANWEKKGESNEEIFSSLSLSKKIRLKLEDINYDRVKVDVIIYEQSVKFEVISCELRI